MPSFDFDWFGARVRIASNSRPFLRYLGAIFPPLPAPPVGRPASRRMRYDFQPARGKARRLRRRGEALELDTRNPDVHAYHVLLADLLERTGGLFVLHGLAVAQQGQSLIVSAPSGFGKTTLAVHLAQRGFGLLTDDLVGIDRATGQVLPFPKTLGLRPGTRRGLPDGLSRRARRARTGDAAAGGDWTVDPVALFGRLAPPMPPSMLVVVRPPGKGASARRLPLMHLRFLAHRKPPLESLRAIAGVEDAWVDRSDPELFCVLFFEGGGLDRYIRRNRKSIILAMKRPPVGPRFDRPPRMWPIGPFQAALELGQEMVNRGHGSRIEREFRGREAHLVMELATLLRRCRCFAMTTGRLDPTLDMLQRRFATECA
jgi:hypothetical protein